MIMMIIIFGFLSIIITIIIIIDFIKSRLIACILFLSLSLSLSRYLLLKTIIIINTNNILSTNIINIHFIYIYTCLYYIIHRYMHFFHLCIFFSLSNVTNNVSNNYCNPYIQSNTIKFWKGNLYIIFPMKFIIFIIVFFYYNFLIINNKKNIQKKNF